MPTTSKTLLPLSAGALHLLLCLREGERHAYFLKREIGRRTKGVITLGNGSLHSTIRRLLAWGAIEESSQRPMEHVDNPKRRYFRLTAAGQRVLEADLSRLALLLASVSSPIGECPQAEATAKGEQE